MTTKILAIAPAEETEREGRKVMRFTEVLKTVIPMVLAAAGVLRGADAGVGGLVHVGIGVSDLDRAMDFYVGQLGLKEAFRLNKADGSPILIYLQVNEGNTFVELFPGGKTKTTPQMPGIYHMGLAVRDLQATLHALEANGYSLPPNAFQQAAKLAGDGTYYYFIQDPDGNHVELSQITADALQVKAAKGLLDALAPHGSATQRSMPVKRVP
jgi:lactoylglutathione lyase